jgi:hypothetical protein
MNARTLLAWTDLEARRRTPASRAWIRRAVIAGALAGLVAWREAAVGAAKAFGTWHSIVVVVFATVMIATPLAMFWRADAGLLARLPLTGRTLFAAAVVRAVRMSAIAGATALIAGIPLWIDAPAIDALARPFALVGAMTVVAATLIPAVAGAAALLIATGKSNAIAGAVAADVAVVPTTWLGALPGVAAAGGVLIAIACRSWLFGGEAAIGRADVLLGGSAGIGVIALAMAWQRAEGMAVALREVAALDRQRLAHLEIHPPRGLERVASRTLARGARLVFDKDARLMRRRYPMAWVIGSIAWLVGGGIAIGRPADPIPWVVGLTVGLAAYAFALWRRLDRPPIELSRVAAQLPIAPGARDGAKRTWLALWLLVFALPPLAAATITAI